MINLLLLFLSSIVVLSKENKQVLFKANQKSKANIGMVSLEQFKNPYQFQVSHPKEFDRYGNAPSVDLSSFQNMLNNNSPKIVNKMAPQDIIMPNTSSLKSSSSKNIARNIKDFESLKMVGQNKQDNMINNIIQMSSNLITLMNKVMSNFPQNNVKQSKNIISNNITHNVTNKINVNDKIKPVFIPPQLTNFKQKNKNTLPLNEQIIHIDKSNCIRLPDGRLAYIISEPQQQKNIQSNRYKEKIQTKSKSKSKTKTKTNENTNKKKKQK